MIRLRKLLAVVLALFAAVPAGAVGPISGPVILGNFAQNSAATPTGTNSTAGKVMGLNVAFTPAMTGVGYFWIYGSVSNGTNSQGATMQLYYGTGTPPSNGTACSSAGTTRAVIGTVQTWSGSSGSAGVTVPFSLSGVANGLASGTPYWIDLCLGSTNVGSVATAINLFGGALEF